MEAIRDENKGTQIEDDSEFDKKSVKKTAENIWKYLLKIIAENLILEN